MKQSFFLFIYLLLSVPSNCSRLVLGFMLLGISSFFFSRISPHPFVFQIIDYRECCRLTYISSLLLWQLNNYFFFAFDKPFKIRLT